MLERGCYECLVEIRARQRTVLRGIAPIGLALAILAPMACEDQMMPAEAPPSPATMPRAPQLAASGATTETAAVEIADAGTLADESRHAVIITTCSIDRNGCLLAQPSSPPDDSSYRVVFGGGVGAIRTRTQAMADSVQGDPRPNLFRRAPRGGDSPPRRSLLPARRGPRRLHAWVPGTTPSSRRPSSSWTPLTATAR